MSIEFINSNYTIQEKLQILADAAKYDVADTAEITILFLKSRDFGGIRKAQKP